MANIFAHITAMLLKESVIASAIIQGAYREWLSKQPLISPAQAQGQQNQEKYMGIPTYP